MFRVPIIKATLINLLIFSIIKISTSSPMESRLLRHLLQNYDTLSRPVAEVGEILTVKIGLTVLQIVEVNEKTQSLTINIWLRLFWVDTNLHWNTSDYGGLKIQRIPYNRVWTPDIQLYNSAEEESGPRRNVNVLVQNNGSVLYVPPMVIKSSCRMDVTWFPFDDQRCEIKFGSWTFSGFEVDLQLDETDRSTDLENYITNGEWSLVEMNVTRDEKYYPCCPEPYVAVTFTLHLKRRSGYYFFNLLVPCALIGFLALLGFTLPPDSGEKLTLGVTVLFSLIVFLNMIAESMPANSDGLPLLGTYFNCVMLFIASSVVSTVVINLNLRVSRPVKEMGWVSKQLMLNWVPWILRISTPPETADQGAKFPNTSPSTKHLLRNEDGEKGEDSKAVVKGLEDDTWRGIGAPSEGERERSKMRIENQWRFGAVVVDRLCFVVSIGFAIGATVILFASANDI